MLVPQSMAYALLAGMPAVYGLYASLVPLIVYPLIGTSRHIAVGIMAIDSMIVAAGVSSVVGASGPGGAAPADYISAVLLVGLMVGGIQVVMGSLRLGFVVNLLSRPVIAGFTAAAALTIGVGQFGTTSGRHLAIAQSPHHLKPPFGILAVQKIGIESVYAKLAPLFLRSMALVAGFLEHRLDLRTKCFQVGLRCLIGFRL